MKHRIVLFIILILSIGFMVFIWQKSPEKPSLDIHKKNQTISTSSHLPVADYTQEIQPTDVLPDPEEVWIIDEEQVQ